MTINEVKPTENVPYYNVYLDQVENDLSLIDHFEKGRDEVLAFFKAIPVEKQEYRYADGKWTVKEILQHLIDAERVFEYRCFRIARHDGTALAGFDQDDYIEPSMANTKSLSDLLEEFSAIRHSFLTLLKSLNSADFQYIGDANGGPLSARAVAFINIGHYKWHMKVIRERYH